MGGHVMDPLLGGIGLPPIHGLNNPIGVFADLQTAAFTGQRRAFTLQSSDSIGTMLRLGTDRNLHAVAMIHDEGRSSGFGLCGATLRFQFCRELPLPGLLRVPPGS